MIKVSYTGIVRKKTINSESENSFGVSLKQFNRLYSLLRSSYVIERHKKIPIFVKMYFIFLHWWRFFFFFIKLIIFVCS